MSMCNAVRMKSNVWRGSARALKRVVREHCDATGDTEDDVVELLGGVVSKGYLNNMCNGTAPVAVDVLVLAARRLHNTHGVEEVCRLSGGTFARDHDAGAGLHVGLASAMKEAGEWLGAVARSLADGVIEPEELKGIVREYDEMEVAIHALQRACETAGRRVSVPVRARTLAES